MGALKRTATRRTRQIRNDRDTIGRRPVIAVGLLVGALAFVLLPTLPAIAGLVSATVLIGVAAASDSVAPGAVMGDVVAGKGGKDRDLPLSPTLLETLREYWRWRKPKLYMFPTRIRGLPAEEPISDKTVWYACKEAAARAGIRKRIGPHTLRHASAYYTTFQSSFILKTIAPGRAQSAAVYGHNGRLALVPARPATRDPFDL